MEDRVNGLDPDLRFFPLGIEGKSSVEMYNSGYEACKISVINILTFVGYKLREKEKINKGRALWEKIISSLSILRIRRGQK